MDVTLRSDFPAETSLSRRRIFIVLCLLASALISVGVSGTTSSLGFYGLSLLVVIGTAIILRDLKQHPHHRQVLVPTTIIALVGIMLLVRIGQQSITVTSESAIATTGAWIGLSYLIFRLIHVVLDSPKLGAIPADDLAVYSLFPPALVAGPIHRATQFLPQLDRIRLPAGSKVIDSFWRLGLGIFKKFFLANAFSLFALNSTIVGTSGMPRSLLWISLFAYSFMIYFDFAGYSDIAVGAAGLLGITLPENFANPYAQPSIAKFWQSWHISLSSWLRDYLFFPISRRMLVIFGRRWSVLIMGLAHVVTMAIAGLWHGFTFAFLAWGLWHGVGLFLNALWSGFSKRRMLKIPSSVGVLVTFVFVSLGWVFFALPSFQQALRVLERLFGR